MDVPVLDQPVSAHPQSRAWAGSTPFRPKAPVQFGGLGLEARLSCRRPTYLHSARQNHWDNLRRDGHQDRTRPCRRRFSRPDGSHQLPRRTTPYAVPFRRGVLRFWSGWACGQAGSVTQWGNTCFSFSASPELYPPSKLGLSSAAGRGALGQFELDSRREQSLPSQQQFAAFQADPLCAGRSRIAFNDFVLAPRPSVAEQAPE